MKQSTNQIITILAALGSVAAIASWVRDPGHAEAQALTRFTGPTSSQPLALSADDSLLLVANPDNNTVSLFDLKNNNTRLAEIPVGKEPNGVALSPDGTRAYVANTVDGTVSVLNISRTSSTAYTLLATIPVGTEPYGLALTPAGRKLYVANARSNSVSIIDTTINSVYKTIPNVGPEPRGIAITNSGTADDSQETVFVTQFLSLPVDGKVDGADDAKAGHVTAISAASDTIIGDIVINPLADTGFKAAGDALQRIAPPATPVADDFKFVTGAYPNQLNNIAIRGKFAYLPNTGASPNGPVRFNVNTQSLLSVIDTTTRKDAARTINMHAAVNAQTNPAKRFITQPWAIAFKHKVDEAYVISAASNILVKLKVDPNTGAPSVQSDPTDTTRVLEIPTGKNPRGIVVTSTDQTAYVMNYVSRDVTAIDLSGSVEKVTATLKSADLPAAGTPEDKVHAGKELYFTSVGELDPAAPGGPIVSGRMSAAGWGSCGSCHPFGHSDNVVWIFPSGPETHHPAAHRFRPDRRRAKDHPRPQLVRRTRRRSRLRAQHSRRIGRTRSDRRLRRRRAGAQRRQLHSARQPRPQSAQVTRRACLGCDRGLRTDRYPRAYLASARLHRSRYRRRPPALHAGQLSELPRWSPVDLQPRALQPSARPFAHLQHTVDRGTAQRRYLRSESLQRSSPEWRATPGSRWVRSSLAVVPVRIPPNLLPQWLCQLA